MDEIVADEIAMTAGDFWAAKRWYEQAANEASVQAAEDGDWAIATLWAAKADRMHAAYRRAVEVEAAMEAERARVISDQAWDRRIEEIEGTR